MPLHALLTTENLALAGAVVVVLLVLIALLRTSWRLTTQRRGRSIFALLREDQGTATIEFVLVFPFALFCGLLLAQLTLLMVGNMFVNYAAFAATRAAITVVPESYLGEERNQYIQFTGATKHDLIQSTAAFALVPVSGRSSVASPLAGAFEQAVSDHFDYYGEPTPRWVTTLAADRMRYASEFTQVRLYRYDGLLDDYPIFEPLTDGEAYEFSAKEPITVRVTHQLNLSIPYVRLLFADGRHDDDNGAWVQVTAGYTLTNEGYVTTLPPAPTLPRNP